MANPPRHFTSTVTLTESAANQLTYDIQEVIELLNHITNAAYYGHHKDHETTSRILTQIETVARKARKHLEDHVWPW